MSWLMVSKLPLMALKFKDFNFKNNLPQFVLIVMAIISAVLLKWVAVPVIFIFYILISLLPFGKTNGRVGKTEL
jgi:CDP-diacylglycerol--serine O-phosphatidyltransferase